MTIQEIIKIDGFLPDSVRGAVNVDFETKPFRGGGYYSSMWQVVDSKRTHLAFIAYGGTAEESESKLKELILSDERRPTQGTD